MKPPEEPRPDPAEPGPEREAFPDYETGGAAPKKGWRERFARPWGLIVALLLLVTAGLWFSPGWYDAFKERRALRFAGEAGEMERAGDLAGAARLYRQAVLVAPESSAVRRTWTIFAGRQGEPTAVAELRRLGQSGAATPEEIVAGAEGSLVAGDVQAATELMARLKGRTISPELRLARARAGLRLAAMTGGPAAVRQKLTEASTGFPATQAAELRLLAAGLLLELGIRSNSAELGKEALDLALTLIDQNSPTGLQALRMVARLDLAKLYPPDSGVVVERLKSHPLHEANDILLAASVEIADLLRDRSQVIREVLDRYRDGSREERLAVAGWLLQEQSREEVLAFIGEKAARADSDLFLVYGDALSGLGRWDDLRQLLEAETIPGLDEAIRHLFLARAALQLGQAGEAKAQWQEVHRYLRLADPKIVLYAARYAESIGANAEAARIYTRLGSRAEAPMEGLVGTLKYAAPTTPAEELLPVYEKILALRPDYPEAQNDYAYLRLLLERDAAAILPEARARFATATASTQAAYRGTLALAELRNGRPAEAGQLFATTEPVESLTPPQKAVLARVLWECGEQEAARNLVKEISPGMLRPSEAELVASIREGQP